MGNEKHETLLTQYLVQEGLISREDLTEALNFQSRLSSSQAMNLGEVLVAMEYLTQSALLRAEAQVLGPSSNRDAELAEMRSTLETEHSTEVKPAPEPSPPPPPTPAPPPSPMPGPNLFAAGLPPQLTPELMTILDDPEPSDKPRLGEILIENHDLEEWQLIHALCIQKSAPVKPRLGTLLVQMGYAEHQAVKRALTRQIKQK